MVITLFWGRVYDISLEVISLFWVGGGGQQHTDTDILFLSLASFTASLWE